MVIGLVLLMFQWILCISDTRYPSHQEELPSPQKSTVFVISQNAGATYNTERIFHVSISINQLNRCASKLNKKIFRSWIDYWWRAIVVIRVCVHCPCVVKTQKFYQHNMELTIVSESTTIVMNHNLTEWSSPSPKSGPLRPKPKPKAVPNPNPKSNWDWVDTIITWATHPPHQ